MLTTEFGAPVVADNNIQTADLCDPALLQDAGLLEKLAHFMEQTRIVSEAYANFSDAEIVKSADDMHPRVRTAVLKMVRMRNKG